MLALLEEETSNLRDSEGEFREPDRCPNCDSILLPYISPTGRVRPVCVDCDEDSD